MSRVVVCCRECALGVQAIVDQLDEAEQQRDKYEKAINDIINMDSCLLADAIEIAEEAIDDD